MKNDSNNEKDWKYAIDVCKSIEESDIEDVISYVTTLKLSASVQSKVDKILSGMQEQQPLLDDNDFSTVINKFKNNILSSDLIGKTIHTYKIIKLLAKGGMSSIYLAENIQEGIKKPVALKILSPYVFSDKSVELFKREQLILSKLNHPNIISFHHSGKTDDGTNYLVMEYVDGAQTIVEYCKQKKFNTNQIVKQIFELVRVFGYSHDNLVIHRDIKSSNILIDKQGNLKVIDFGIGQLTYRSGNTSTQVFTLDSASPEQIMGKRVNIQTDVFSLGAVFLQLLIGKEPLPKTNIANYDPQNDTKHISKLLKESKLDSDLQNIIKVATHIDLQKRYENMGDFAQDLGHWIDKKPISATADSFLYRFKKFVLRKPLLVTLASVTFVSMLIALIISLHFANNARIEVVRTEKALDYFINILSQTDSMKSNISNISLKQALDLTSDVSLEKLDGDELLKKKIHLKLGEIYLNLNLYEQALSQSHQALTISTKLKSSDDIESLNIKVSIGQLLGFQGRYAESIKLLEEVLAIAELKYPDNSNLIAWVYSRLLHSYSKINANVKVKFDKDFIKKKLSTMLESSKLTDIDVKLSVLDMFAVLSGKEKKYQKAVDYNKLSLAILERIGQKKSINYSIYKSNIAYNYILLKKFEQAQEIFIQLINELESTDPDNSTLGHIYENYADLLFKMGKYDETMKLFTKSVNLAKRSKNLSSLYNSLTKRAKFSFRINRFKIGLSDQLEVLPIKIELSGKSSYGTLINSANLSLMLYTLGLDELAYRLMQAVLNQMSENHVFNNIIIVSTYAVSGISNWHIGNISQAQKDLENILELQNFENDDHILFKILQYLLNDEEINKQIIPTFRGVAKSHFYSMVYYLLQLRDGNKTNLISEQDINEMCEITYAYRKVKTIAIKQLFLTACKNLYENKTNEVPSFITDEIDSIKHAKTEAQDISKELIQSKVNLIIKLIEG